jgi:hypothetical protein
VTVFEESLSQSLSCRPGAENADRQWLDHVLQIPPIAATIDGEGYRPFLPLLPLPDFLSSSW